MVIPKERKKNKMPGEKEEPVYLGLPPQGHTALPSTLALILSSENWSPINTNLMKELPLEIFRERSRG